MSGAAAGRMRSKPNMAMGDQATATGLGHGKL